MARSRETLSQRVVGSYAVLLHGSQIGRIHHSGDFSEFEFTAQYLQNPNRPVLGLWFEEHLNESCASALLLPPWFSNLLPEGPLRQWIAEDRGVSAEREMELLAQVGHDLPGAVQVVAAEEVETSSNIEAISVMRPVSPAPGVESAWRFSLAGVALKFSMLEVSDRLTIPAAGEHGDWLVKFPDYRYPNAPVNEFLMMRMAGEIGIDTPEVRLIHRDELPRQLPKRMWPGSEQFAYAVRRFDRKPDRSRRMVHVEDFAQVLNRWTEPTRHTQDKYRSKFETVAGIAYRGRDLNSLAETVRRISFNAVIGNGDAHLKNWALIYPDGRNPKLSPVYDLVSTIAYQPPDEVPDFGLKLAGSKRFDQIRADSFVRLQRTLQDRFGAINLDLSQIARDTASRVSLAWTEVQEQYSELAELSPKIDTWIEDASARLATAA
ncbi:putative kinase Y4dM [Glycomyces algeriensis]|uniref:Kinase Y4dM n=2 Tax=Glycomyces algeriensis TaxID=256037 RepID=A0A9W6G539_9ACTN|nr:putative kinase Y4dM [Glycomyces algeriensis]